jgi:hypothetical protein
VFTLELYPSLNELSPTGGDSEPLFELRQSGTRK